MLWFCLVASRSVKTLQVLEFVFRGKGSVSDLGCRVFLRMEDITLLVVGTSPPLFLLFSVLFPFYVQKSSAGCLSPPSMGPGPAGRTSVLMILSHSPVSGFYFTFTAAKSPSCLGCNLLVLNPTLRFWQNHQNL